jgi:hypothetical protein
LRARFFFATPTAASAAADSGSQSEAARTWSGIQDSEDVALLAAFRLQYGAGNPLYDQLARRRLEILASTTTGAKLEAVQRAVEPESAISLYRDVFKWVHANYPEPVNDVVLLSRGTMCLLDKYPGVLDKAAVEARIAQLSWKTPAEALDELLL